MTFTIDTVDGRGLSNEACHELLPKKSNIVLVVNFTVRGVLLAVHY